MILPEIFNNDDFNDTNNNIFEANDTLTYEEERE